MRYKISQKLHKIFSFYLVKDAIDHISQTTCSTYKLVNGYSSIPQIIIVLEWNPSHDICVEIFFDKNGRHTAKWQLSCLNILPEWKVLLCFIQERERVLFHVYFSETNVPKKHGTKAVRPLHLFPLLIFH